MSFDAAKLAYAYNYLRRKYLGPRLTSGTLTSGSTYLLQSFKSGDNFAAAGAASNFSGVLFVATATAPTWPHGSALRLVDLAGLKALADTVFSDTTDPGVTITSASSEGGQGSGVVTFDRVILGQAIEKLLTELDPDYDAPPSGGSRMISPDWRFANAV